MATISVTEAIRRVAAKKMIPPLRKSNRQLNAEANRQRAEFNRSEFMRKLGQVYREKGPGCTIPLEAKNERRLELTPRPRIRRNERELAEAELAQGAM